VPRSACPTIIAGARKRITHARGSLMMCVYIRELKTLVCKAAMNGGSRILSRGCWRTAESVRIRCCPLPYLILTGLASWCLLAFLPRATRPIVRSGHQTGVIAAFRPPRPVVLWRRKSWFHPFLVTTMRCGGKCRNLTTKAGPPRYFHAHASNRTAPGG
jgi:hypothetical protein